jgi:hypothetical protein
LKIEILFAVFSVFSVSVSIVSHVRFMTRKNVANGSDEVAGTLISFNDFGHLFRSSANGRRLFHATNLLTKWGKVNNLWEDEPRARVCYDWNVIPPTPSATHQ